MSRTLFGEWRISLFDESWEFKPDDLKVSELVVIEREFDGSFDDLIDGLNERAPVACQVLVWFLRGRNVDRLTVDFPPRRLKTEMTVDPKGVPVPVVSTDSDPQPSDPSPASTE